MPLCYSALSPFCRKVRMVMEWKEINFSIFDSCDIEKYPAYNPRAEIPVLVDDAVTVVNSADILLYLDRKSPDRAIYPEGAADYAHVREWERTADTIVDAVVTDIAVLSWSDLPLMPDGLLEAAMVELTPIYDRMAAALASSDFLAGDLSVADFSMYPQIGAAHLLGIRLSSDRHGAIIGWLKRMRQTPWGKADLAEVKAWWARRSEQDVDTRRINWGTHRLEWFLANGFLDRFVQEVKADRVLWSVGPNANAKRSPLHQGFS